MTNLDTLFDSLRAAPAPDGLARIESRVIAGLAIQRERVISHRGLALAGAISMAIGLFANLLPANEARKEPIFGIPAAAPSHLLAG